MGVPYKDEGILSARPSARVSASLVASASTPGKESSTLDVRAALKESMARLRAAQVPSCALAAELLLMHALGCDRTWLYTHPEAQIESAVAGKFFELIARRIAGEPCQYLTGRQEFWGLEFEVSPAVLIPRPETEHVVEVALDRLGPRGIKIRLDTGEPSKPLRVGDVGTGSGCLAVALAHELPHATVFATDISAEALGIARRNAICHKVSNRIHFVQADLLDGFIHDLEPLAPQSHFFDLIVSNPPYVGSDESGTLPREVRDHEPREALFGGPTGVEMYARLIEQAGLLLGPGGILVLELGYKSADHVIETLRPLPKWVHAGLTNDLAGIPRVLAVERTD